MTPAERYVRRGTEVPVIYHGSLYGLRQALKETMTASRGYPGAHTLEAVYGSGRVVLRVFEDGECTWTASAQDKEEA